MIFYCHHANGDLFESKALIEAWRVGSYERFSIAHKQSKRLFLDQPWLNQIELADWMDEQKPWVKSPNGETAVNLWIGRGYVNAPGNFTRYIEAGIGLYIEGHFLMHNDIRLELGLDPLPGTSDDYWPDVHLKTPAHLGDSVLICNGPVRSLQAENFDFSPAIMSACLAHPEIGFYATEKPFIPMAEFPPNLTLTESLFLEKSDLPEICTLSRNCRLIVGRKSGPHVWAQSRSNLLHSAKTILAFTVGPEAAWNVRPNNPKVLARRKWMPAKTFEEAEFGLLETLNEAFTAIDKPFAMD